MNLFNESENLLPFDGEVNYYGLILSREEANRSFDKLLKNIEWKHDEAIIYGKRVITKRKVAWYGDRPFEYTYSRTTKRAIQWIPELLDLKIRIEKETKEKFNSCLLNFYHTGDEGMAWHSDAEKDLKKNGAIASLSLGAERKFMFKHKSTKDTVSVFLEKGSLLVMKGETQSHWQHRLPPTKKCITPRINLTFRTIDLKGASIGFFTDNPSSKFAL